MPREDRDAIEMLERCHRQLEKRLAELSNLAAAMVHGRGTAGIAGELRDTHARFARSATRHVADEEASLFPRLPEGLAVVDTLRGEHRVHESLEAELALLVEQVAAPCPPDLGRAVRMVIEQLRDAYHEHIEREERELVPRLRELPPGVLDAVLAEMQSRRGDGDGDRGGGGGGGGGGGRRGGRGGGAKKRAR